MLKSEGLWCDAAAFRLEVECHRYPEALRLYSGPLLDGFYVTAAPEFEQWLEDAVTLYDDALAADPENAYLQNRRAYALFRLHRYDEAVEAQRKSRAADPNYA